MKDIDFKRGQENRKTYRYIGSEQEERKARWKEKKTCRYMCLLEVRDRQDENFPQCLNMLRFSSRAGGEDSRAYLFICVLTRRRRRLITIQ